MSIKKNNPNQNKINSDFLLSIDVDAHLQKVASNTYRSAAHYPVELVRCAIKRGSSCIQIDIDKKRLKINDNGSGINQPQLEKLCTLLESKQSFNKREQSILDLQNHQGIGLLAIFSSSPSQVSIQNITHSQKIQIQYQGGRFRKSGTVLNPGEHIGTGTRIVLIRKTADVDLEKLILQKYCQYAKTKIILNGQQISQEPLLRNSLVSIKMKEKENRHGGLIGIPKYGDVCRIWLLDQGILLSRKSFAPWRGFIFEAIVEYSGEITGFFLSTLLEDIHRLYLYMIGHHKEFPLEYQLRIEELIFKHHRLTHDPHLVNRFSPFRTAGSSSFFSLPQLQKKAEKGVIYGILDRGKNPININNQVVLILNPLQVDYLVNYICLPIRIQKPSFFRLNPFTRLKYSVYKAIGSILKRKRVNEKRIIPFQNLSDEEKIFVEELFRHISKKRDPDLKGYLKPVMIKSKGILPAITTRESDYTRELLPVRIILRKNHSLVKKAIQMVSLNPDNIEWIAPLFVD